ncbi:hypothetical protein BH11MYX2_BH11MYX2_32210 [soil metagenome]
MISTARGLALIALIAIAMVATLFIDLHRAEPARDHTLVSGFDEARVVKLTWSAPPSSAGAYLAIERGTPHAPWRRTLPSSADVDQGAVGDILAALRGGRWQRVGTAGQVGEGQVKLTIEMRTDSGVERIDLGIGAPAPSRAGSAQQWIARGDRAYLVDAWVAQALMPSTLSLSSTHPLAPAANAPTLTFWNHAGDVTVSGDGTDNRVAQIGAGPTLIEHGVRLDPMIAHDLERALANIEVVALSSSQAGSTHTGTPIAQTDTLQIEWAGSRADLGSTSCNNDDKLVELTARSGGGCVSAEAAGVLRAIVAKLRGPATQSAAPAPVPFAVGVVELGDGQTLDLTKSPKIGARGATSPADRDRTQQLLAALATRATVIDMPTNVSPPARTLFIRGGHGAEQTLVVGERPIVWRAGERVALRVTPEAYDAIARGPAEYTDLQLWTEEPTTVVKVVVIKRGDTHEFSRGAVVGEWTGARAPSSVEALVALLAAPHAEALVGWPWTKQTEEHGAVRVLVTIQPPAGAPFERSMSLTAKGPCEVSVANGVFAMKPALCAAAAVAN